VLASSNCGGADIGSPEGDELEMLALLIEKYGDQLYPMPPSDPIEATKFRMDQQGYEKGDGFISME
jgi:HTH-type transcriptional regulator/antitoxin HigA